MSSSIDLLCWGGPRANCPAPLQRRQEDEARNTGFRATYVYAYTVLFLKVICASNLGVCVSSVAFVLFLVLLVIMSPLPTPTPTPGAENGTQDLVHKTNTRL